MYIFMSWKVLDIKIQQLRSEENVFHVNKKLRSIFAADKF